MEWGRPKTEDAKSARQSFAEPTKYDSVFWVEVDRIQPNPYQPRREFDEARLKSLAESIRQYGVLQPLVVTRTDVEKPGGGLQSVYELIAGERRLRASKLIGLREVPVVIRVGEQTDHMKLELAIIENLQREDLNAIDRAKALAQLAQEFGLTHPEIGAKVGRSREFVSNSIRLLSLPEEVQQAVVSKEISEGHARALLMLASRPEELRTVFTEIVAKKTSVRMVEQLVRRIAQDKIRRHNKTPEMMELEKSLTEKLGTRVVIENRTNGGRVLIEFFSPEDLSNIVSSIAAQQEALAREMLIASVADEAKKDAEREMELNQEAAPILPPFTSPVFSAEPEAASKEQVEAAAEAEDLYSVRNFSI
jgi:ParB family chromosome partitioning protein